MQRLHLVGDGVIFRNPDPGHRHISALFPNPLELPSGEMICCYNQGSALYAADLTFVIARSSDGGRSWRDHRVIYDRSLDDRPYSYHGPFVSRMHDGTLLIGAFRSDRSDPERPMFNEVTGGLHEPEVILLRSADDGHTWGPPEVVQLPPGIVATPATAIIELADGSWFWPFDQWKGFDDPSPYQPRTLGFLSRDQGGHWDEMIVYADGAPDGLGFWHGKPIPLADGRLAVLYWAAEMATGATLTNHMSFGSADGRDWSKPLATNLPGQTNALVDLGEGRYAAIYTRREGAQPAIMAALSVDGGQGWDLDNQLLLWDATGRDRLGVVSLESYPRSHDTIAFGAPAAVRLADGAIYATWWCMEAALVHVRWARIEVA